MSEILGIEGLRGGYGQTEIIHGASLSIVPGETFALIGKNGMGKSTLLKLIMGLLQPNGGRVNIRGEDVGGRGPNEVVRRSVTYVPQEKALFQDLTVEENLRLGTLYIPRRVFGTRVEELGTVFPFLGARLKQQAGTLSGGEQKMLLLARALLPEPKILLVDEVSEGVQPLFVAKMGEILSAERSRIGTAVLLVEQNISFALSVAHRFGVLRQGVILDEGDPRVPGARERAEAHLMI